MLRLARSVGNVLSNSLLVIAAAATSPAFAQWVQVSPSQHPRPTVDSQGVFDTARGVVVMFGGMHDLGTLEHNDETWEYDGTDWHRVLTAHAPSPRRAFAMAYDSDRQRVVLLVGTATALAGFRRLGNTMVQTGHKSSRRHPLPPTGRWRWRMIPLAGQWSCLAGHFLSTTSDTWEYDGVDWRRRDLPVAPSPRKGHAMEWCPERNAILLYGGATSVSIHGDLANTWEYDGSAWRRLYPLHSPGTRGGHRDCRPRCTRGPLHVRREDRQRGPLSWGHMAVQGGGLGPCDGLPVAPGARSVRVRIRQSPCHRRAPQRPRQLRTSAGYMGVPIQRLWKQHPGNRRRMRRREQREQRRMSSGLHALCANPRDLQWTRRRLRSRDSG